MKVEFNLENDLIKKLCIGDLEHISYISAAKQYRILGILCMHRCAGIVYHYLKEGDSLNYLSREMQNTLSSIYKNNIDRTNQLSDDLDNLYSVLETTDIKYALLKGAKLKDIYPIGTRTSNDIDILISREDIPRMSNVLINNGFKQGYIRNGKFCEATRADIVNSLMNRGEITPFIKIKDNQSDDYLEVDVNISVDEQSIKHEYVVKQMLEHREANIKTKFGKLYSLDTVDFLIHLCTHLYKEASNIYWAKGKRDLLLYKFLDIYIYCNNEMNRYLWEILKERIEFYKLKDAVNFSVYYTNMLWKIQSDGIGIILDSLTSDDIEKVDYLYDQENKHYYKYTECMEERIFNEQHLLNTVERV